MSDTKPRTVTEYLAMLPPERRAVVSKVRDVVRRNLPKGYVETLGWGMINYEIPLAKYPQTYNGKPMCYAAVAAQKNHYALYLMGLYADPRRTEWFAGEFKKAGKKLDMGKSCVRFQALADLPLDVIGKTKDRRPLGRGVAAYALEHRGTIVQRMRHHVHLGLGPGNEIAVEPDVFGGFHGWEPGMGNRE